jgi:hypothetical protein
MRKPLISLSILSALIIGAPPAGHAESSYRNGAGVLTATAHVDFQITIPQFLFLRVGTGTGTAAGGFGTRAKVDRISWAPTAAQLGTGPLAGTGGDLAGGVETAVVVANGGNVTLSSATKGPLTDANGDTISFGTINTTASHNTTGTTLPAPALVDGATTSITLTAVNKIVRQDAKWAYSYANAGTPAAGTYGGVNVRNSRVTYTASVP